MRKITVLILISLILVSIWNAGKIGYNYLQKKYFEEISSIPVILISGNHEALKKLATHLKTQSFTRKIIYETHDELKKHLIEQYELAVAEDLIEAQKLPNRIKLFIKGPDFTNKTKLKLKNLINQQDEEIFINYNDEFWQIEYKKINLLEQSFNLFNYIYIPLALLLIFYLRLVREKLDIYLSEQKLHRPRTNLLNSIILSFIPVLLSSTAYFILKEVDILSIDLNYYFFGIELVLLLIVNVVAQLFPGNNYDK